MVLWQGTFGLFEFEYCSTLRIPISSYEVLLSCCDFFHPRWDLHIEADERTQDLHKAAMVAMLIAMVVRGCMAMLCMAGAVPQPVNVQH